MVERRNGGETGVEWVQAYRGDSFWKACEQEVWSPALVKAALCRSHTLVPALPGFTDIYPTIEQMRSVATNPLAYHYQYWTGCAA